MARPVLREISRLNDEIEKVVVSDSLSPSRRRIDWTLSVLWLVSLLRAWRLAHREQVSLSIVEPGGALADSAVRRIIASDLRNAVNCSKPGHVVVLEYDSPVAQLGDNRFDIINLPGHLGVLARRPTARFKQRKASGSAFIAQSTGP